MVYLIPSQLLEEGTRSVHPYTVDAARKCEIFFCENQRTTRRFLKQLWKLYAPTENLVIDNYEWHDLDNKNESLQKFRQLLKLNKKIGIVSEAGCPGIADPGQRYVSIAQELEIQVIPLVGPNSILLALMASGMNGQQFQFVGYLPIDNQQRVKSMKDLESESARKNCTQVFIETPYRNNQLLEALLKTCAGSTKICIAMDITGEQEWIKTRTITEWKKNIPQMPKTPAIFLLLAGS